MTFAQALRLASRTLARTPVRAALMAAGIVVGVSSLTVLQSIGENTKRETIAQVKNMLGTFDTVLIRPGAGKMRGMVSVTNVPPNLKFGDATAIGTEVPGIKQVGLLQNAFGVDVKYRDRTGSPAVFGVSANWLDLRGDEMAQGNFFSDKDVTSFARVAVLGSEARKQFFPDNNALGKTILIGDVPFQVIGQLASRGAGPAGANLDDLILVPVSTASKRLFNRDFLTMMVAQLRDPSQSAATINEIDSVLRRRHHLAASATSDFTITDPRAVMQQLVSVSTALSRTLVGVAVGATVLGGVIILILMLMGVSERRREIGIRRSIGASRLDILFQFLLESLVIATTGGLTGMVLAVGALEVFRSIARISFVFSPANLAMTASIAVAAGLIAGFYPAWRAASVDPVIALRT